MTFSMSSLCAVFLSGLMFLAGCQAPPDNADLSGDPDPIGIGEGTLTVGTVTGNIIDSKTKNGLSNVIVIVENSNPPVQARSDTSGNFVLSNVYQGTQMITVSKPGYVCVNPNSIEANILPNQTVALQSIDMVATGSVTPDAQATHAAAPAK